MHFLNLVHLLVLVKRLINVRHAQSLQQKQYQVYKKKYSHALPILVFQLLSQLNQLFFCLTVIMKM